MAADPQMQQRVLKFALFEAALNLLVLLPALIYLFVYDNRLSLGQFQAALFGVLAVWALLSTVLFKIFIMPRR